MDIRKTAFLLSFIPLTILAPACGHNVQAKKPIVIVDDEQNGDDKWMSNVLAACPGVLLGVNKETETDHYLAQLLWRDNRWSAVLWRDAGGEQYVISAQTGSNYNALLNDMCSQARNEIRYEDSGSLTSRTTELRYDMHDLRNGNVATSEILDRKTGRVWIWTTMTDSKGVKTKTEFIEEDLVPNPSK
jgi:hypothetical protein